MRFCVDSKKVEKRIIRTLFLILKMTSLIQAIEGFTEVSIIGIHMTYRIIMLDPDAQRMMTLHCGS